MNTIIEDLTAFFASIGVSTSAPASILAGVSGGADSVALARLLHLYRDDIGVGELAIAHVNHGLRGAESDGDEAFVRGLSGEMGVEFFCIGLCPLVDLGGSGEGSKMFDPGSANTKPFRYHQNTDTGLSDDAESLADTDSPKNLESWARSERYKFFHRIKSERGFGYIATAHTANDQAETLLMRMARGAGLRGLRGVLPLRGDGVIRPLIGVERRQIEAWLSEGGYGYRTDSSNADVRFRRNLVRLDVIPKLIEVDPAAVRNIAACAEAAALAWIAAEGRTGAWIERYAQLISSEILHIEKAGLSDPVAREALLILFDKYGIPPTRRHIERVMAAECIASGEHLLPGGWRFYPREDRVCFVKAIHKKKGGRDPA